jgi:hypothetical protein
MGDGDKQLRLFDAQRRPVDEEVYSPLWPTFWSFHEANPEVYRLFKRFTLQAIRAGRQHYSAYAVCHQIRWHIEIVKRHEGDWKLNNNFIPFYARVFHRDFPQHADFFETRTLKADRVGTNN